MENLEWVDKRNDVDDVNAEDINLIAHYSQELNKNKADNDFAFDYYYTFDSMVENYDEYTEPGIYKIKHVLGMHSKVVLMLVRRFSTNGVFQLKFSPNQITSRTGNVGEDGKITWEEWGKFATESYVDEKLGDIETALDTIIAMQNELTGGGEV